MNKEIVILDSLRGAAALFICLFHFVCGTIGFASNDSVFQFFGLGVYGVQIFFVISGFIIPWSMFHSDYKVKYFYLFILKRLTRLEPMYIISIIVTVAFLFFRAQFLGFESTGFVIDEKQIALHIGYLIPFFSDFKWLNQAYWTLAIEFQYYVFIALLFIPLLKCNLICRIAVYLIILALSFFSNSAFLPFWLPIFMLGIITFFYLAQKINQKEYSVSMFLLILFCLYKYQFVLVAFSLFPVFAILFLRNYKVYGLNFLGKISYSIYLFHSLFGAAFINITSHYVISPFVKFLVVIGGLCITILSSSITYYFIEKPTKKMSTKIKYERH